MISEVQYYLCHHEEVLRGGTLSIMPISNNLKRGVYVQSIFLLFNFLVPPIFKRPQHLCEHMYVVIIIPRG